MRAWLLLPFLGGAVAKGTSGGPFKSAYAKHFKYIRLLLVFQVLASSLSIVNDELCCPINVCSG